MGRCPAEWKAAGHFFFVIATFGAGASGLFPAADKTLKQ
jgi:hypothetical protein